MGMTLSPKFLEELGKCSNMSNVVVEFELDGGPVRFGFHGRNALPPVIFRADGKYLADGSSRASGSDELPLVVPALKAASSLQNRIDVRSGYTTRGQFTLVITGRENFGPLVRDEYLKNRRVTRKDGFIARGFTWPDYASTFTGKVLDWSRKGDELTVVIADDLKEASAKIPAESESRTAFMEYRAMNPADIMADIIVTRLGVDASLVDLEVFASERDRWLSGWKFDRTLTEPLEANQFLNELQVESNSFIVHDGEKIGFKVFAPPAPGQMVDEWTDRTFLKDSFAVKSGYRDGFCNRVVVYYDYDESGGDREGSYESAVIAADAASQSPSQWKETSTRTIKSKWIRSHTFTQQPGLDGVKVYHASRANGEGTGQLSFVKASSTLTWTSPGGAAGEAVKLTRDGKCQVFDADKNRYVRVLVSAASLPAANAASEVDISAIGGGNHAATLAGKLLNRYRDPVATMSFDVDINCMATGASFMKPADMKDLTTDEACTKGAASWIRNRVMLTSVRPDFASGRVSVEGVETKMSRRYGFIAPAGLPDYEVATSSERAYGYLGDASNLTGGVDGYHIW
jgi:hypothetical protein